MTAVLEQEYEPAVVDSYLQFSGLVEDAVGFVQEQRASGIASDQVEIQVEAVIDAWFRIVPGGEHVSTVANVVAAAVVGMARDRLDVSCDSLIKTTLPVWVSQSARDLDSGLPDVASWVATNNEIHRMLSIMDGTGVDPSVMVQVLRMTLFRAIHFTAESSLDGCRNIRLPGPDGAPINLRGRQRPGRVPCPVPDGCGQARIAAILRCPIIHAPGAVVDPLEVAEYTWCPADRFLSDPRLEPATIHEQLWNWDTAAGPF